MYHFQINNILCRWDSNRQNWPIRIQNSTWNKYIMIMYIHSSSSLPLSHRTLHRSFRARPSHFSSSIRSNYEIMCHPRPGIPSEGLSRLIDDGSILYVTVNCSPTNVHPKPLNGFMGTPRLPNKQIPTCWSRASEVSIRFMTLVWT